METLSPKLQKIITDFGFTELTRIQKEVIPSIASGKNIVIRAPTGYGKTLAAFLPMLDRIDIDKPGVQLLYITPLRSLNRDVFKNIINIGNKFGVEIDVRHGDTSAYERANQVSQPPHCLITTPETLQSMFLSKKMMEHMKNLKFMIVDEVQSLMESKRGTQFSVGLERLKTIADFQIVGISATISDFEETKRFLGCTESISFEGDKKYDVKVIYPSIEEGDENVAKKQEVNEIVATSLRYIEKEISSSKSTLIFTNTRETAELLGSRLAKFLKDKKMEVHHSSLSKEVRMEIENKFKVGDIDLMIATSSLELGIDIGDVDLVIQYMSPRQVIKLIQRVGRSNHRQEGIAVGKILTINVDDYLESQAIEKCRQENKLEVINLPMGSLDILAHQIVGIVMQGITKQADIYALIKRSYAYKDLDKKTFNSTLDFLIKHYMLRYYGDGLVRTRRGLLFYISNISSIPNRKTYFVIDSQLNKRMGVLDEEFVAEHGKEGESFVMRGETWKIVKVEQSKISVIRAHNSIGAIPAWEGELMPVHRFVAEAAGELRHRYASKFSVLQEQNDNFVIPDKHNILIERVREYAVIHSTFGNKVNEAFSKALSAKISMATGESVITKIDPYRVIVKILFPLKQLQSIISTIDDPETLVKEGLSRTSLYEYRFLNVAKRMGVINKYADFTKMHLRTLIDMYKGSIIEDETYNELFRDKIDFKGLVDVLKGIKDGSIKVTINDGPASPLTYEGLENTYGGSIMKPEEAKKALREMVIERLKATRMELQCLNCGYKIGEMNAGDADGLQCRKCHSKYIGFYKAKYKDVYQPIITKGLKNKQLTKEEKGIFDSIKQSGALYLAYSGKACIVGASYGVGPATASRILASYSKSQDELIDKVIEAEKNYIETREFWN
jgi:ATP-dependent Lhr-like helicase